MMEQFGADVEWITAREAAAILGVTQAQVYRLARRDLLPCIRQEAHYYFRRPQIEVIAHARETRWRSRRRQASVT